MNGLLITFGIVGVVLYGAITCLVFRGGAISKRRRIFWFICINTILVLGWYCWGFVPE